MEEQKAKQELESILKRLYSKRDEVNESIDNIRLAIELIDRVPNSNAESLNLKI